MNLQLKPLILLLLENHRVHGGKRNVYGISVSMQKVRITPEPSTYRAFRELARDGRIEKNEDQYHLTAKGAEDLATWKEQILKVKELF